jgi:MobA/MobL family
VLHRELVLPQDSPAWARQRERLWNAAETPETRKNSTVAREFEIALPSELKASERARLAVDFARAISIKHRCAVDVSVHRPGRGGDTRNHHAHLLCTTRRLGANGFTEKTRELDGRC